MNPFQNPILRDYYFSLKDTSGVGNEMGIWLCEGQGPFNEQDWYDFLLQQGCAAIPLRSFIDVYSADRDTADFMQCIYTTMNTVYRTQQSEYVRTLSAVLEYSESLYPKVVCGTTFNNSNVVWAKHRNLRLYSQEMLLMWLSTRLDPYLGDPQALARLKKHSALSLDTHSFQWPSTDAQPSNPHHPVPRDAPAKGLLELFGYHVGKYSAPKDERRRALVDAYNGEIPQGTFSLQYTTDCGAPRTAKRLQKMAFAIAALVKSAKRNPHDYRESIEQWESDLAWLKENYYIPGIIWQFDWPDNQRKKKRRR